MGALKWGLKATLRNLRTIVHNCAILWPFWALSKGNFSSQNDDNRRQSWTIVDKYLKPPFAKPPFRLSRNWKWAEYCFESAVSEKRTH